MQSPKRNLAGACLAHFLHDGYTDMLYALLPVWKPEFGLSYAGLALLRALYSGTMGGLQLPADRLTARFSPRWTLCLATVLAAAGYLFTTLPFGLAALCGGLFISGIGSSVQHSRASLLVSESFAAPRGPLSVYNFTGDLGKSAFPALVALLLPILTWRPALGLMALAGVAVSLALLLLLPARPLPPAAARPGSGSKEGRGFSLLLCIGALDTAARMGYLLFLPFLIRNKLGHEPAIGLALALLFIGSALGKAGCGWLGQRLGVIRCVALTEAATALLILTTLILPLAPTLAVLPLLGLVLNGTSSVLYGTVPELARHGQVGRAFALFYTGVLSAGGLAPILYGLIADAADRTAGIAAAALTAAVIIPLVMMLRPFLRREAAAF